jgi:hypothetical protein
LKRFRIWLEVLTVLVLIVFISSCTRGFYSGTSSTATTDNTYTLKGVVIIPNNNCFTDVCKNSSTAEGEPLPNADILLKCNNGQILTGKTNCQGEYEISGLTGETYLLYANREMFWGERPRVSGPSMVCRASGKFLVELPNSIDKIKCLCSIID